MSTPATTPAPDQTQQQPTPAAAPAPAPQQPQTTDPGTTATIPQGQAQASPTVLVPEKRGGLGGLVDEIRNALEPSTTTQVYRNPETGERYVQHPAASGKGQWLRLASEAVQGAAAGLAAGRGAGNMGKAAAAGVQSGLQNQQRQQQAQQLQEQRADEDYEIARQNRIDKANSYLQQVQLASAQFALTRAQHKGVEDDVNFAQQQEDREKNLGSVDLGVYPNHYDLAQVQKVHPEFWKSAVAGDVQAVPAYDDQGNRQGVHLFLRQQGIGDQPATPGTKAYRFVAGASPEEPPHLETFTPSGTHTQRDIDTYNAAAYTQLQKWQTGQADIQAKQAQAAESKAQAAVAPSTAAKNYAEASEANAGARNLRLGLSKNGTTMASGLDPLSASDHDEIVKGMLDGTVDIEKTFGNRNGSPLRAQYIAEAKRLDPSWSEANYRVRQQVQKEFASNEGKAPGAQITSFNYAVGHIGDFMDQINRLHNTNSPLLNRPLNWLKANAGNPEVDAILTPMDTSRTEIQRFIEGAALTESDKKGMDQKLNLAQTPATMDAVAKEMLGTGVIRLGGLNSAFRRTVGHDYAGLLDKPTADIITKAASGNDPYSRQLRMLVEHHLPAGSISLPGTNRASAPPAPAGATSEVHDGATGALIGHVVNGQYVPIARTQ